MRYPDSAGCTKNEESPLNATEAPTLLVLTRFWCKQNGVRVKFVGGSCCFRIIPGHGPQYLWNASVGGKTKAGNLPPRTGTGRSGEGGGAIREFDRLGQELIAVNESICQTQNYLRIRAGRAELSANGAALFANDWLNESCSRRTTSPSNRM
jgi:hypothetical protein